MFTSVCTMPSDGIATACFMNFLDSFSFPTRRSSDLPGATASCTVVITSGTTGTTVVSATSSIPLTGGGSVNRTTNGTAGNSAPSSKTRTDATIAITPAAANNAVGTNNTLTITVTAVC